MASSRFRSILDGADPTSAHLRVPEGWVVDSNSGRPCSVLHLDGELFPRTLEVII
jgi:hypothetical protein